MKTNTNLLAIHKTFPADGLALFTLDIDNRHTEDGTRVTSTGCVQKEVYPYFQMLRLILDGVPPSDAATRAGITGATLPDIRCGGCEIGPAGHEYDCPEAQQ